MTYEEIMNNDAIEFVIFSPGLSRDSSSTILRKRAFRLEDMEKYYFDKIEGDKVWLKHKEESDD